MFQLHYSSFCVVKKNSDKLSQSEQLEVKNNPIF